MAETSQVTLSPKDVRIVYHAGDRTFARLFNERSLAEVKDVVRRKLGLGADTDVSLKQMGSGSLLDLEDDGDFQAFRVFLKSSVSVDIEVTVGRSQGSVMPPPVTPKPQEQSKLTKKTTSVVSPAKEPASATMPSRRNIRVRMGPTVEAPTTPGNTPLARKRKVSFDATDAAISNELTEPPAKQPNLAGMQAPPSTTGDSATPDKPTGQRASQPAAQPATGTKTRTISTRKTVARKPAVPLDSGSVVVTNEVVGVTTTPAGSAKTAESPAGSKPQAVKELPKKKRKRESTAAKEVKTTETVETPSTKPSATKASMKKVSSSDHGSKAETPGRKDDETSEPPAKKPRRQKKDVGTSSKKTSAPVDQGGMGQPTSQSDNPVNEDEAPIQPAVENVAGQSVAGSTLKAHRSEKADTPVGACAAIPQTSESASVQSEVAAAIISSYLSKANGTVPPPPPKPPAKRKYVRRAPKKIASSSALIGESLAVAVSPANEIPNVPAEHGPKQVIPTDDSSRQTADLNRPLCPICLGEPFHIRYYCPTVLKGPDAIRKRLEELKGMHIDEQQSLIKQLEGLLGDSEVTLTDGVPSGNVSLPSVPFSGTPKIPILNNSYLSEVTVENRDEGSSSDSSDETSKGGVKHQEILALQRQETLNEQPLPFNDELEAIIRGPMSKQRSILDVLDRIVGNEDDEDSGAEKLEEDPDEETSRLKYQPSRRISRSSDPHSESESEREASWSLSPPHSAQDTLSNNSKNSAENPVGHQEADVDVLMEDPADPPALEGRHDDGSKETHAGLQDHIVVDQPIGEGSATAVTERPSSPVPSPPLPQPSGASLQQPSNAAGDDTQESVQTPADPTPNQEGSVPPASKVLKEAEVDPIEPADDPIPSSGPHSPNADPIEASDNDIGSLFVGATRSTPKPGVSNRIKNRNGEILGSEAERPILLEQLATDEVTPVPAKGESWRKVLGMPASQEPVSTRKSLRFSSVPPSTTTPAAKALLDHKLRSSARSSKAARTPVSGSEERSKSGAQGDAPQDEAHIVPTPSLNRWETLAEPSSPSVEPSLLVDELMSSSPQPDDMLARTLLDGKETETNGREPGASGAAESSPVNERLFDLSSSQMPFPYSQNLAYLEPAAFANRKENERSTDTEEEPPQVAKRKTNGLGRYRSLSQLASNATLFSPSFPTPANKSMTNGRGKKRAAEEDSSSSSSSSDDDEAAGSHIPRERRAGSALETKKRKGLLSGL